MTPAIVRLSRVIIPRSAPLRILALIVSAHLDESGTHKGSTHTVLAGYVATEGQWAALDWDWKILLNAFGMASFHAHEFYSHQGAFKHLTKEQRLEFERVAFALLARSTIFSAAMAVVNADHDEYKKDPGIKHYSSSHYGFCFSNIMPLIASASAKHLGGAPVSFVLEAGDRNAEEALKQFNIAKFGKVNSAGKPVAIAHLLGAIAFDRGLSSLEAADLLAYRCYQQLVAGEFKDSRRGNHMRMLWDKEKFSTLMRPSMVRVKNEMAAYSKSRLRSKKAPSSGEQPS